MTIPWRASIKILLNSLLAGVAAYQTTGQLDGATVAIITTLIALVQKPPKINP